MSEQEREKYNNVLNLNNMLANSNGKKHQFRGKESGQNCIMEYESQSSQKAKYVRKQQQQQKDWTPYKDSAVEQIIPTIFLPKKYNSDHPEENK